MCSKFSDLALLRKCLLTPVLSPQIFAERGGRGRERSSRNGEGETEICHKNNWRSLQTVKLE